MKICQILSVDQFATAWYCCVFVPVIWSKSELVSMSFPNMLINHYISENKYGIFICVFHTPFKYPMFRFIDSIPI